jgi:AcrR family transcriptional regulator
MSPRPYRMERRRESTGENRLRILHAARELLASEEGTRFSLEQVARRAKVARMTVYYQFGSLGGLLRALLDSLALAGGMDHLADAFRRPDPLDALDEFIGVFMGFWESDRPVLRGLGALAVLNPDFAEVLEERYAWRRKGIRALLVRVARETGRPKPRQMDDAADLLYLLTSFATYDMPATPARNREQIVGLIRKLARQALA